MRHLRLLLDQMRDVDVATRLKELGHAVVRVSDVALSRADDAEILARAISERRILVTIDKHFGDWAVLPLSHHPGVIRIRATPTTSTRILDVLLPFLETHGDTDFENQLAIVRAHAVRWVRTDADE